MTSVFISYRRETAAGEARALYTDLVSRLGDSAVFMDVDSISLGRDFRKELHRTLEASDLMLVIIDRDWVTVKNDKGGMRLADPGDYVRMEIEAALKRDIVITPVLVKGARMPAPEELPAEIADLAYRNGFEISHGRWASDIQEMSRRLKLEKSNQTPAPALPPEPPEPKPSPPPSRGFFTNRSAVGGAVVGLLLVLAIGLYLSGIFPTAPEPPPTVAGKAQIKVYAQVNKEADKVKANSMRGALAGSAYLVSDVVDVTNKPIPKSEIRYCDPQNKGDALALKEKLESEKFNSFEVRPSKCNRQETKNVLEVSIES